MTTMHTPIYQQVFVSTRVVYQKRRRVLIGPRTRLVISANMRHIANDCSKETEENDSPLNTHKEQQMHWYKFEKAKESVESHLMDSEVIDSEVVDADKFNFEDELNDEDCNKGLGFCIVGTANKDRKVVEDLQKW